MNNASDIIIDLIENNKDIYEIHKANFLLELIDYTQNSDYSMFRDYQDKTFYELLSNDNGFLDFASILYYKFIDSNIYNLYEYLEDNYNMLVDILKEL